MSGEYKPRKLNSGTILQAGIPTRSSPTTRYKANGILLRGVVTATYVLDDPNHPAAGSDRTPVGVYCDVLVYTNKPGQRWCFYPQSLVLQDRGALHSGRIWKPRASSFDITGANYDVERGTPPGNMDGDWVLLGFIDDHPNSPVVLGGISHPNQDVGNEGKDIGHRMKLTLADGDPDFFKHKGAYYGIDNAGNYTVDTTQAYALNLETNGHEPDPPNDGTTGNYNVKLPAGSTLHVQVDGGESFKLEFKDAAAKLTLGDGTKSATIYEALETFWNTTLKPKFNTFDTHVHPTGVGPSGVPSVTVALPSLDVAAKSTKLKIPDA